MDLILPDVVKGNLRFSPTRGGHIRYELRTRRTAREAGFRRHAHAPSAAGRWYCFVGFGSALSDRLRKFLICVASVRSRRVNLSARFDRAAVKRAAPPVLHLKPVLNLHFVMVYPSVNQ